jgi:hypothetical protein
VQNSESGSTAHIFKRELFLHEYCSGTKLCNHIVKLMFANKKLAARNCFRQTMKKIVVKEKSYICTKTCLVVCINCIERRTFGIINVNAKNFLTKIL